MIHLIKPVVPPPTDRRVLLLLDGVSPEGTWVHGLAATAPHARAWCEPPTLTEPSGPVHSLEAAELPAYGKPVLIRVRGNWYRGERQACPAIWVSVAHSQAGGENFHHCTPDAWRELPDDEPGDAELLEAARRFGEAWRNDRKVWTGVTQQVLDAGNALEQLTREGRHCVPVRGGK